ncbi:CocE/NonD family hydrolase [Winogradskyella aurantiaca]|uniref:CocE/NonD family hydrolase n=1 Tax=Winogradskyella aurantiaca TaxID=2219558 RepID=UPI000E1DC5E8|nr:CocE/NonD family hydrolase [Winogradskyella aurantiaca]
MKYSLSLLCLIGFAFLINAQTLEPTYIKDNYTKTEYSIPMRDGLKLFTIVYTPKDQSKTYPILLNRTCYNASRSADYDFGYPSSYLVKDKYIMVFQDVRGRYMSEGLFTTMTPNIPGNDVTNTKDIDESSDTYDTIEWLINNIPNNNKKVGMLGISYPGFYTAAGIPDAHPALKASSPQAPIADFFFDDFHHHGAFLQSYTAAFAVFGYQKDSLTNTPWYTDKIMRFYASAPKDGYNFHLEQGPLKNITKNYHFDNFFWKEITEHPNYDEFWQRRSILPHLKNVNHAVMTVGGWFDAEDLYGPLNIYKSIEESSPNAQNTIVMGPWDHGGWARERGKTTHNHIYFGDSISTYYQRDVERKFFAHYLKGKGDTKFAEALMFDTGSKKWETFKEWPPKDIPQLRLHFGKNGRLGVNQPLDENAVFDYTSDPAKPVPYRSQTEGLTFTPRQFMTDDQRHASTRPDVLTFQSDILTEDTVLAGEIIAKLKVAMTGTDADFVVKLIDVYPDDHPNYEHNEKNIVMAGYQQLVRSEVYRGRFRNSYETPEPFVPNQVTDVNVPLQDILHTFKKGHRIMIQIHSTWFPYIDRNPQKYVDNIYEANEEDFIKSTISVYGNSVIEIGNTPDIQMPSDFKD